MEETLRQETHNGAFRLPCKSLGPLPSLSVVFSSHIVLDGVRIQRLPLHVPIAKIML